MRMWIHSYVVAYDVVSTARRKKHGKGKLKLEYCLTLFKMTRYICYGQWYHPGKMKL